MPGYVIHLAIAEEYLRKHKNKKESYNEFIEGVIFPDSVKDKSETHYGEVSSKLNLFEFLKDNKIEESFKKGYFLHLLTDYLFYNKYIDTFSKDVYNDYDILNKGLIEKYSVNIPEKVKDQVFFKEEGTTKILSKDIIQKFIEDVSNMDLDSVADQVRDNREEWTTFRTLKYIALV